MARTIIKPGFDRAHIGFYRFVLTGTAIASLLMLAAVGTGLQTVTWPVLASLLTLQSAVVSGLAWIRVARARYGFRWLALALLVFAPALWVFGRDLASVALVGLSGLIGLVASVWLGRDGDDQVETRWD